MNLRRVLILFFPALCILCLTAKPASTQIVSTADLRAAHRATLESWLQNKPRLRLAIEKDCLNREGLAASRAEYGRDYQPYYSVGDFNRDGQQDFAVALINGQKHSRKFAVAIFNGPFNQRRPSLPAFFTEGIDLSEGGLFVLSGGRLVAGVFQSDDCVVLQPRRSTYVMKTCL
jgi:hypothetical protein